MGDKPGVLKSCVVAKRSNSMSHLPGLVPSNDWSIAVSICIVEDGWIMDVLGVLCNVSAFDNNLPVRTGAKSSTGKFGAEIIRQHLVIDKLIISNVVAITIHHQL